MADKNIQEGDEVSWNWGSGQPTGTVAEIKTSGQLEIESKGKQVHKNADPDNPAVHVERSGNDVVKRASELTKLSSATEGEETEANAKEAKAGAIKEYINHDAQEAAEKPSSENAAVHNQSIAAGGKHGRENGEAEMKDGDLEQGAAEKEVGKKSKKAKTTKADLGPKKSPGRPRKGSKSKIHAAGEAMQLDPLAEPGQEDAAPKKKGPGRPKKSDASDRPPVEHAATTQDVPATRTRSKDD